MTHTYQHTGITPYSCDICGTSTTTNSLLNRHLIQHKNKNETVDNFPSAQRERIRINEEIKRSRNKLKYDNPSYGKVLIEEVEIEPLPPKKKRARISKPRKQKVEPKTVETVVNYVAVIEEQYEIMEFDYGAMIYEDHEDELVYEDVVVIEESEDVQNEDVLVIKGCDTKFTIIQDDTPTKDLVEMPKKSLEVLIKEQRLLTGKKIAGKIFLLLIYLFFIIFEIFL